VTVRFLADEDIDVDIVQGLRSREPAIDIRDVKSAGLRGSEDPALPALAAGQDRILISHDRNTMTRQFCERLASGKSSSGLFIVPKRPGAIGDTIEWLLLVWAASQSEEWRDHCLPATSLIRANAGHHADIWSHVRQGTGLPHYQ
jgi:uncharacterized protein DUF5615